MTDDDCREIFAYSLKGRSDFTEEFLNEIFSDYSVENLKVINLETPEGNSWHQTWQSDMRND